MLKQIEGNDARKNVVWESRRLKIFFDFNKAIINQGHIECSAYYRKDKCKVRAKENLKTLEIALCNVIVIVMQNF